jgi:hypothetical protein
MCMFRNYSTSIFHIFTFYLLLSQIAPQHTYRVLDYIVSTRCRSPCLWRRRRAHPIATPFLESCDFPRDLRGKALLVIRKANPSLFSLRSPVPIGQPFHSWGRFWIVKPSNLVLGGLGLFAGSDITVPLGGRVELFPFYGPRYSHSDWLVLSRQCRTFGRYGLRVLHHPGYAFMDGYPPRTGCFAGYINSSRNLGKTIFPNAEWEEVEDPHKWIDHRVIHYVMTVAIASIRRGEEVLVDYDFRHTWVYSSK